MHTECVGVEKWVKEKVVGQVRILANHQAEAATTTLQRESRLVLLGLLAITISKSLHLESMF